MKRFIWLMLLAMLDIPQAQAINQEIRTLFQPGVTLPNGLTDSAGQAVRRKPLGIEATAPFQPGSKPAVRGQLVASLHGSGLVTVFCAGSQCQSAIDRNVAGSSVRR